MKKRTLLRRAAIAMAAPALVTVTVLTAQSASATTVINGGALTEFQAVSAKITKADTQISYTFAGKKGKHLTFSTSSTSWSNNGSARWLIYSPTGVYTDFWSIAATANAHDFTPNVDGTWKLVLAPLNNATGSAGFTFASDDDKGVVAANKPVTVANTVRGQNMDLAVSVTTKDHLSFDVTASQFTDGTAIAWLYTPGRILADKFTLANTPTFYDFSSNETGAWKLVIDPQNFAKGSVTVVPATDQAMGELRLNTPVKTTISSKGQNAGFTVNGVAGDTLQLNVPQTTWGTGGSAYLLFWAPDGTLYDHCTIAAAATTCKLFLNYTGTYKVTLDPIGAAVGSATLTRVTPQD